MKQQKRFLALAGSLILLSSSACQSVALPGAAQQSASKGPAAVSAESAETGHANLSAVTESVNTASAATTAAGIPGGPDTRTGAQLDTPFSVNGVILVNKKHHVSANYRPEVTDERRPMDPVARAALTELLEAASAAGFELSKNSGYRSYETQKEIFDSEVAAVGEEEANKLTARPGESEHQTGLAVDLTDDDHEGASFSDEFGELESGKWLAANAYKYGFILRYLKGKEAVTGYNYEPWHFRYVGKDLAAKFGPNPTMTLEEYLGEQ